MPDYRKGGEQPNNRVAPPRPIGRGPPLKAANCFFGFSGSYVFTRIKFTMRLHLSSVFGMAKTPLFEPGDPRGRGNNRFWRRKACNMTTASSDGGPTLEKWRLANDATDSGTYCSQISAGIGICPNTPYPLSNTSSLMRCISNFGDVE